LREERPETPCLIVSAHTGRGKTALAERFGSTDDPEVLCKPFLPGELLSRVDSILGDRERDTAQA
jgi:DNA-binding response OmpR family regulator